jgi:ribokinase
MGWMESSLVAVVGSLNLDLVFRTPALPKPGQTLLGGTFATHPGGKGGNQAAAIGNLGGNVSFVGAVGGDANGKVLRDSLSAFGVDVRFLSEIPDEASGTACILVDSDAMNMIVVAPGANMSIHPEDVTESLRELSAKVVLAQLEIPLESVVAASEAEMFILNPAPARDLPDLLLANCYLLTPNETELESLTGVFPNEPTDCDEACKSLFDKGVRNVVVTLGSRGSYWVSPAGSRHFPAPSVNAIDTTAAGDAFNGALAHFLASGREMANSIALANCVGALATTKHGAQESMPTSKELATLAGHLL